MWFKCRQHRLQAHELNKSELLHPGLTAVCLQITTRSPCHIPMAQDGDTFFQTTGYSRVMMKTGSGKLLREFHFYIIGHNLRR